MGVLKMRVYRFYGNTIDADTLICAVFICIEEKKQSGIFPHFTDGIVLPASIRHTHVIKKVNRISLSSDRPSTDGKTNANKMQCASFKSCGPMVFFFPF